MAFWKFTGSQAEVFPSHGITARPGYVYDLGTDTPPDEPITDPYKPTPSPKTKWIPDAGPATDFLIFQASDLSGTTGVSSVDGETGDVVLSSVYVAQVPAAGSYTYDGSGRITGDPDGNTYTYNGDDTIHTVTKGGVTRTATYGANGIASWA